MGTLFKLFFSFAKMGLFTFGGGYAMLPMIKSEIVEKNKWATEDEIMDYYAIGQVTPGVIAVNTATFVGHKVKGLIGSIFATMGMIVPPIIIITLIAIFLKNFSHLMVIKYAFNGIRACVCVQVFQAIFMMAKKSLPDFICIVIFILVIVFSVTNILDPTLLVVLAGVTGIIIKNFTRKKDGGKSDEASQKIGNGGGEQ